MVDDGRMIKGAAKTVALWMNSKLLMPKIHKIRKITKKT